MERQSISIGQIRAGYPDLAIRTARLDTSGQNSDILIVNASIIFRFPRYAEGIRRLPTEVAILRAIQPQATVPVPNPIYAHLDSPLPGAAFLGYPMLPGAPLSPQTMRALDATTVAAVAADLAAFLRALHGIPTETLGVAIPDADSQEMWAEMYRQVQAHLFPLMRPDARSAVAHHFEPFLGDSRHHSWTPVLRHGDFGPSNILFDAASGRVTGIIDFGSAARGDPAVDLAALSSYGPAFLTTLHTAYPATAAMKERSAFYAGTFALQEALFGKIHDDAEALANGIATYR